MWRFFVGIRVDVCVLGPENRGWLRIWGGDAKMLESDRVDVDADYAVRSAFLGMKR